LSLELEGITADEPRLDVFFAVEPGRSAQEAVAQLRRDGFAADTDFAGRSLKGQVSHGEKRARALVLVTADGMTLRRRGELDVKVDLAQLEELLRS
ncbi:MAG TPA: hypothetical protein VNH40_09120, partial [Gaiellaceae bacterium]|nr:hypothetical protein [Gaiellaceae bacterium]